MARHYYNDDDDKIKSFKNNDDVALRMVYYQNNNFNWNEDEHLTREKLGEYYEKDEGLAFDCLIENDSIYFHRDNQKVMLSNMGNIPCINRFMANLNRIENRKKQPWELANDLQDRIEKEELEEQAAEYKAQEELEKQQKLEDSLIEIHKKISNLQSIIVISFILVFMVLIIL